MDGDADLEREAHRIREEGIPCVPPLVYLLWDPGEVDPPASSRPQKIKKSNLLNLSFSPHHYYGIISYKSFTAFIPTPMFHQTTSAMSSDLCRSRTHVKFPDPLFNVSQ
jgi:hypothetical protein